jgi:DNA-directed RNA polymerase
LETYLDGRVQLTYYEETNKLDPKDMALAIAPNFVHSMDACLLRMAVMKGVDRGLKDFGMVHDSFGVHAADMAMFLRDCIKPAFVEMYTGDVLRDFAGRYFDIDLPPIPQFGTLDLNGVLESDFFFS